ncbi:AraC family transcriptional regulator [Kibdelosporangium aridum]|uniref:AraC family transcriptional regulator n=1 Tax=Kibdelosporangium aridum TaxID=2030 RepID=A0A428ZNV9_KIBAR|nr:AraC family transcriptional regulator [Kibdelosporangium aridum]RSM89713.1 AraC family transcriptional regulator [Kibdelosporangium aridum]
MSTQTVPIHVVHRVLKQAQRRGTDVMPLLRAAGIPGDIAYRPKTRVTIEQMAKVTRGLWQLTNDELFGIGPPIPLGTMKFVALSIIHAPDLREVIIRFCGASKVLTGVPRVKAHFGETVTRVEMDVSKLDDPENLGTELLIALVHRLSSWLIGRRISLKAVELPYPEPPYAADYQPMYGRIPTFDGQPGCVAIEFDSALLDAPVVRDEKDLAEYMSDQPGVWYARRDFGSTTADQVRKILERGLSGTWPTAEEIADRLSVSVQHLRRLLRDQKTSVSEIKEEILRDAAIASLVRGEESVDDLAVRLGFSEASAFRRAFRRWTGSPPGAYRTESS